MIVAMVLVMPQAMASTSDSENSDNERVSYFFGGVQGGGQVTFSNYDFNKLFMPVGAVSVGGYYNPVVGGRLHFMGFRDKGGFKSIGKTYYYDYYTADADLLVNLTNLFWRKSSSHLLNLVLVGGVGLNYGWHNSQVNNLIAANSLQDNCPEAWKGDRLGHNFRVGLQLDVNVSKHLGVNLECDFNNLSDRFNSKKSNGDDWQAVAMVGLQYKFGYKKFKKAPAPVAAAPAPAPKPAPAPVAEPAPAPAPAPAAAPVLEVKTINENIFYKIGSSAIPSTEMGKVTNVAKFLKDNPDATIDVVGYADVKTGNPTLNMRYSRLRAEDLRNKLVKAYGISRNRINVSAKGDTEQPFAENAKNRVSIVTGSTKK